MSDLLYDVGIIGAGPAGVSTAIRFARMGLQVRIIDSKTTPIDKACGEGIMPSGVRHLEDLDVLRHIQLSQTFSFCGVRYHAGNISAEGQFWDKKGLGIRRVVLSDALHSAMGEYENISFSKDTLCDFKSESDCVSVSTMSNNFRCRLLVGADGLRSKTTDVANLTGRKSNLKRYGMVQHYTVAPWSSFVEVTFTRGAECYVTPLSDHSVGVAILFDKAMWRQANEKVSFDALMDLFPDLKKQLKYAEINGPCQALGPLYQRTLSPVGNRVALVGDAAGYVDAITGEGISLGLAQSKALIDCVGACLLAKESKLETSLADYKKMVRAIKRNYEFTTWIALQIARFPRFQTMIVGILKKRPRLFDTFLRINMNEAPIRSLFSWANFISSGRVSNK